jgi:hypothetical protein
MHAEHLGGHADEDEIRIRSHGSSLIQAGAAY